MIRADCLHEGSRFYGLFLLFITFRTVKVSNRLLRPRRVTKKTFIHSPHPHIFNLLHTPVVLVPRICNTTQNRGGYYRENLPVGPLAALTPNGGFSIEGEPPALPQLDRIDDSSYPLYSFGGPSSFAEAAAADEHFGGTEATARVCWGSPVSEPGSPAGVSPRRARLRATSAGIGGKGGEDGVGGGTSLWPLPRVFLPT